MRGLGKQALQVRRSSAGFGRKRLGCGRGLGPPAQLDTAEPNFTVLAGQSNSAWWLPSTDGQSGQHWGETPSDFEPDITTTRSSPQMMRDNARAPQISSLASRRFHPPDPPSGCRLGKRTACYPVARATGPVGRRRRRMPPTDRLRSVKTMRWQHVRARKAQGAAASRTRRRARRWRRRNRPCRRNASSHAPARRREPLLPPPHRNGACDCAASARKSPKKAGNPAARRNSTTKQSVRVALSG